MTRRSGEKRLSKENGWDSEKCSSSSSYLISHLILYVVLIWKTDATTMMRETLIFWWSRCPLFRSAERLKRCPKLSWWCTFRVGIHSLVDETNPWLVKRRGEKKFISWESLSLQQIFPLYFPISGDKPRDMWHREDIETLWKQKREWKKHVTK